MVRAKSGTSFRKSPIAVQQEKNTLIADAHTWIRTDAGQVNMMELRLLRFAIVCKKNLNSITGKNIITDKPAIPHLHNGIIITEQQVESQ